MNDLDNDLFDDGMIVSADEVIPHPDTVTPVQEITVIGESFEDADTGLDPLLPSTVQGAGLEEPGEQVVTPPDIYVRKGNTIAPDGSALTPNQTAKPELWRAGERRILEPTPEQLAARERSKKNLANRVNVREMVAKLAGDTMLSPIEILYYIMNANEESRHHLGLRKSDRISANLRAKCAQELLTYMAPKLKSVEVKTGDPNSKGTGVQIFLPANEREQGEVAEQPRIVLPEKDGVTVPFSPELAAQLILADDEEKSDWTDL